MSIMRNVDTATASGGADAPTGARPLLAGGKYALWSAKGISSIGTINVTTLYQPGKLKCTIEEINKYRWDVLGLAETHWTGSGEFETEGIMVLFSGRDDNIHREGVAIMLNKRAKKTYIEHKAVSSRIISVRMKGQHKNVKIIQVYAPDTSHTDEDVENFYEQLEEEIRSTKESDMLIVMGDFNSKIGEDNHGYEDIMGKFGCGTRNEHGEKMLEFCQRNELFITNTQFFHRKNHRHTWTHPTQIYKNCIDYVLVKKRWKSSFHNTKVMHSADFGTSHELVLSNIKIKFKSKKQKPFNEPRFNVEKLREDSVREEYKITIGGKFAALMDLECNTNELWTLGKDILVESAENLLGTKRKIKQIWMTQEVLQKCDERRDAKRKKRDNPTTENKDTYRRLCREVENKCKQAKREWVEQKCNVCEESFRKGNSKELFKTVKELTRKWKPETAIVRNEQGQKVSEQGEVKRIWKKHFEGIMTGSNEQVDPLQYPEIAAQTEEVSTPEIMTSEIEKQIRTLAPGKAPGGDGISQELLKAGDEAVAKWITKLCQRILDGEDIPKDWLHGTIIPIHKKGDHTSCSNYRPINLMSHGYKIMAKWIHDRIKNRLDEVMGEEQAGFRTGRGTADQVFTLAQIIEKTWEYDIDLYAVFIDFKQAFDSVWREGMIQVLKHYGFEKQIVDIIERLYNETVAEVKKGSIITDTFKTERGIIQGCPLSPQLFNLLLEKVMELSLGDFEGGIMIDGVTITNLRYADDIVLLGKTQEEVRRMTELVEEHCKRYKLNINVNKTKVMKVGREQEQVIIDLEAGRLEQVEEFKYLGVSFTKTGDTARAIQERIKLGYAAMNRLTKIWKENTISRSLKIRLFNAIVVPTVLYGAESWVIKQKERKKLLGFEMKCLRRICNVRWQQMISNERIREMTGTRCTIEDRVRDIQLRWFGHVERMSSERWPRKVMYHRMHGKRPRARPRTTWLKTIKDDNMRWQDMTELARDRQRWEQYRHQRKDPTWPQPEGN